ncbi:hypothetical protein D3C84_967690 [compost metagenome]
MVFTGFIRVCLIIFVGGPQGLFQAERVPEEELVSVPVHSALSAGYPAVSCRRRGKLLTRCDNLAVFSKCRKMRRSESLMAIIFRIFA